jgi:PhnB protein
MQMSPYLNFQGNCEEAFGFYAQSLGGQLGPLFRYAGTPITGHVADDWHDKIMHGSVTVGDQLLMGADVAPERYKAVGGFSLSLQIPRIADAERVFHDLAEGGTIVIPLEKTLWAARFGMVVDRFGIPWQINCEGPSD